MRGPCMRGATAGLLAFTPPRSYWPSSACIATTSSTGAATGPGPLPATPSQPCGSSRARRPGGGEDDAGGCVPAIQGPQVGQCPAWLGRSHPPGGLWPQQGAGPARRDGQHVLRHARVHGARGLSIRPRWFQAVVMRGGVMRRATCRVGSLTRRAGLHGLRWRRVRWGDRSFARSSTGARSIGGRLACSCTRCSCPRYACGPGQRWRTGRGRHSHAVAAVPAAMGPATNRHSRRSRAETRTRSFGPSSRARSSTRPPFSRRRLH